MLYCGSGWRSSLAWLLARLMGHPNVASFDGSLLGWSLGLGLGLGLLG